MPLPIGDRSPLPVPVLRPRLGSLAVQSRRSEFAEMVEHSVPVERTVEILRRDSIDHSPAARGSNPCSPAQRIGIQRQLMRDLDEIVHAIER